MKLLLRLALVLLALLVIVVIAAGFYLDSIARTAIEEGGTYALGVDTTLEKADVGLTSGRFAMNGLAVTNPDGFEEPRFFTLGDAEVELSLGSLLDDTIHIPKIVVDGVHLDLERTAAGANYKVLLDNLARFESGEAPSAEQAEGGKKFLIDELVLRDVGASIRVAVAGKELEVIPVQLPEIRLTNIGSGEGGQSLAQLFGTVLKAVVGEVVKEGGGLVPDDLLKDLGGQLQALGDEALAEARAKVEEKQGELEEKASQVLGEEAEKALGGKLDQLLKKKD